MVKISVPVKILEKDDVCEKVKEILRNDRENAYTVSGIMIKAFGIKEQEIDNKNFAQWKKGLPTLYGKIDRSLKKFKNEGAIDRKKHGKAWVYWWIKPNRSIELSE